MTELHSYLLGTIAGNGLVDVTASFDTLCRTYVGYGPGSEAFTYRVFKLSQRQRLDVELSIQVLTYLASV
jgi:hypothetical protein